jgi:putative transposase
VVDRTEPLAAKHAEQWAAWGHRKVWGLLAADGVQASPSSVRRAMARRGLLQPVGYQAERRQLAKARRAVFLDPPTRRNRVWQTDFSELESLAGGIWRMSGVVEDWAKLCLARSGHHHPGHPRGGRRHRGRDRPGRGAARPPAA